MRKQSELDALAKMAHKTYRTGRAWRYAVKLALKKTGNPVYPAIYDENGDCITCCESGRCGGWHLTTSREAWRDRMCDFIEGRRPNISAMTIRWNNEAEDSRNYAIALGMDRMASALIDAIRPR